MAEIAQDDVREADRLLNRARDAGEAISAMRGFQAVTMALFWGEEGKREIIAFNINDPQLRDLVGQMLKITIERTMARLKELNVEASP